MPTHREEIVIRYVRWNVGDWIGGTDGLSPVVKGCYMTVLMRMYADGGPTLDDRRAIAHACGCSPHTWAVVRSKLLELGKIRVITLPSRGDRSTQCAYLVNSRVEKELIRFHKRSSPGRGRANLHIVT